METSPENRVIGLEIIDSHDDLSFVHVGLMRDIFLKCNFTFSSAGHISISSARALSASEVRIRGSLSQSSSAMNTPGVTRCLLGLLLFIFEANGRIALDRFYFRRSSFTISL